VLDDFVQKWPFAIVLISFPFLFPFLFPLFYGYPFSPPLYFRFMICLYLSDFGSLRTKHKEEKPVVLLADDKHLCYLFVLFIYLFSLGVIPEHKNATKMGFAFLPVLWRKLVNPAHLLFSIFTLLPFPFLFPSIHLQDFTAKMVTDSQCCLFLVDSQNVSLPRYFR